MPPLLRQAVERPPRRLAPIRRRLLLPRTARVLADTLQMGYTTVRDGGGLDAGFKVAIEEGLIPGPRLVLGIQIVSPTGGIGDRVSPSGHTCCAVYDPLLPNSVANGPDGVRDVVRTMVRAGADVIKTAGSVLRGRRDQAYVAPGGPIHCDGELAVQAEAPPRLPRRLRPRRPGQRST